MTAVGKAVQIRAAPLSDASSFSDSVVRDAATSFKLQASSPSGPSWYLTFWQVLSVIHAILATDGRKLPVPSSGLAMQVRTKPLLQALARLRFGAKRIARRPSRRGSDFGIRESGPRKQPRFWVSLQMSFWIQISWSLQLLEGVPASEGRRSITSNISKWIFELNCAYRRRCGFMLPLHFL